MKLFVLIGLMSLGVFGLYRWSLNSKFSYREMPEMRRHVPTRNVPPWERPKHEFTPSRP